MKKKNIDYVKLFEKIVIGNKNYITIHCIKKYV